MSTTPRCLALVVAILSCGLPAMAQTQRKPDATSILNNMFRMYSRLTSYHDEGILITTNDEPTGGTIEKMPFKTFFKRPNLFRFEWTDFTVTKLGRTYRIWFNGTDAFTYWEPDRYEKDESLGMAVAGATGVSQGTVNTVSSLLLPADDSYGSSLKKLSRVSLLGEEVFEGVRCYRIKARDGDETIELWVGKFDLLLRKTRQESKEGDRIRIEEEVRRKIQTDQPISEAVFNYEPPIALTPRKDTDVNWDRFLNPGPPAWSEFRSEEGKFSILLPEKPVSQTATFDTAQGRFEQHVFTAMHHRSIYLVSYTDLPKQSLVETNPEGFFDGVRDQYVKGVEGKLASESPLTLDGHPGREIKANVFRGELRLRVFLVGDRMYMLVVTKVDEPAADEPAADDAETLNKFFSSFKLISATNRIAANRTK